MKKFKFLIKNFSSKNSKFVEELKNDLNEIKIEKKHVVDSDFDNKNDEFVFDISDIEDNLVNEKPKEQGFDFDKLEKRNKELNENKKKSDSPVLQQLRNIIAYEESKPNKMEFKDLKLKAEGKSEAPSEQSEYLVKRPSKNFIWGLGQKTKQKKCNFFLNKSNSYTENIQALTLS
jgi:hypothetical protein